MTWGFLSSNVQKNSREIRLVRFYTETSLAAYNLIWPFTSKQILVLIKDLFGSNQRRAEEEQYRGKNSANYRAVWKRRLENQLGHKAVNVVASLVLNFCGFIQGHNVCSWSNKSGWKIWLFPLHELLQIENRTHLWFVFISIFAGNYCGSL